MKKCQETVKTVTEHNDQAPLVLRYMEYTENKDKDRLVEKLCGEMSHRNHNKNLPDKQSEPTENMSGTLIKQSQEIGNLLMKPLPKEIPQTEVLNSLPNELLLPRFQCKLH